MKSKIAFAILFLILPSACASGIKFSQIDELGNERLSPRSAPAKVITESDESLKKKGYLTIGWISKETVVASCWNPDCDNFRCPAVDSKPTDFTGELTRKAAENGGDLVFMRPHKGIEKTSTVKKGKCRRSHVVYNLRTVYKAGEYRDGNWQRTTVAEDFCDDWESIDGYQCASISKGTVWRHDPELAESIFAIEREKNRITTERERFSKEAIRNKEKFAALKKAYEAMYRKRGERADKDLVLHVITNMAGERRYGYKDKAGNIVIEPQFTDCHAGFYEGLAAVSIDVKRKRVFGFIDKTGKWVIDPVYRQVSIFSEGLASVEEEGKKAGFIDKKGNFVIEPVFDHAFQFIDGKAEVWLYLEMGIFDRATGKLYLEK